MTDKWFIPPEAFAKTPAWKELQPGQKWLILNTKLSAAMVPGDVFIHTFKDGKTQGRMELVKSDGKDHICKFVGWMV